MAVRSSSPPPRSQPPRRPCPLPAKVTPSFARLSATLLATAATASALAPIPARAQVGFSLQVGQPGYFGQLNVGNLPPPQLLDSNPVTVVQRPWGGWSQPI